MIHAELLSRLRRARDLLRDWEDEPLSVSAAARASGLTRFHFIRLFKAIFGETPHQYRSRAQVEKSETPAHTDRLVDHRRLHGSRLFQPWQLQRSFLASGGHVTNGISTTVPLSIGT